MPLSPSLAAGAETGATTFEGPNTFQGATFRGPASAAELDAFQLSRVSELPMNNLRTSITSIAFTIVGL